MKRLIQIILLPLLVIIGAPFLLLTVAFGWLALLCAGIVVLLVAVWLRVRV